MRSNWQSKMMKYFALVLAALSVASLIRLAVGTEAVMDRGIGAILSDKDQVTLLIRSAEQAVREGNAKGLAACFSDQVSTEKNAQVDLDKPLAFTIKIDSIDVRQDKAVVYSDLSDYSRLYVRDARIQLMRTLGRWKIDQANEIGGILVRMQTKGNTGAGELERKGTSGALVPAVVTTSSRILVPVKHPGTSVFLINRNGTQQALQRNLFSHEAILSMDMIIPDQNGYEIGFMSDRYWDRIVFGKQEPGNRWFKSYGDNAGDYDFSGQKAITIDPFDTIFVADTYVRKLVKLFFNRSSNTITFIGSYPTAGGVSYPSDISYDQGGSLPCWPDDGDGVWLADDTYGVITRVNRSGNVDKVITHYTDGSTTYPLAHPINVCYSPWGWAFGIDRFIGVIDRDRNAFVTVDADVVTGGTAPSYRSTEFDPVSSELTCIGIDWFGQFWVGDKTGRMYHTFSVKGDYLASVETDVNGTALFQSPVSISRSQHRFSGSCSSIFARLNIVTSDLWGATTGLRNFYPGADAINLSATLEGNDFVFRWTLANSATVSVEVLNESNQVIHTIYSQEALAGFSWFVSRPRSLFEYGYLKLRVTVLPRHNDLYPSPYQQSPLVREIQFANPLEPPTGLTFSNHPSNVYLTWSPVLGADQYHVYYNGTEVGTAFGTSYWHQTAQYGQTVEYFVKASKGSYQGPQSSSVNVQPFQLASTLPSATASNGQRKLVRESGFPYYLGYESSAEIWLTESTNGGSAWSPEFRVSDGTGTSGTPSIATSGNFASTVIGSDLYIVYRKTAGPYYYNIMFREKKGAAWQNPIQLNTTSISSSVNSWPVIGRTNTQDDAGGPYSRPSLLAVWESNEGLRRRFGYRGETGNWVWETDDQPLALAGNKNPSMSSPYLDYGYVRPYLYITWDNNNDIFLAPFGGNWSDPLQTVPASIAPVGYSSQVGAKSQGTYPTQQEVHVVWEAYGEEQQQSTDGGGTWAGTNSVLPQRKIMYQAKVGSNWTVAHEFKSIKLNVNYYRPSVVNLSNGNVVVTWDNGVNVYRTTRQGGLWSTPVVAGAGLHANLVQHGTSGLLSDARYAAMGGSGPLFGVQLGGPYTQIEREVTEQYSRRIVAARTRSLDLPLDTAAHCAVELSEVRLKLSDGTVVPLFFVPVNDSLLGFTEDNAWSHLATEAITLSSAVDSILVEGTAEVAAPSGLLGIGFRDLRLNIELIDARDSTVIRRLGTERIFSRDTLSQLRVRERLSALVGREIIIRPTLTGIAKRRKNIIHTLVHVHTLMEDSAMQAAVPLSGNPSSILTQLPSKFELHQNYPNPFNPSTQIRFDLPEAGNISIIVYDVLGREVAALKSGYHEAGYHSTTWDASRSASGVYIVRFIATSLSGESVFERASKLLLLR